MKPDNYRYNRFYQELTRKLWNKITGEHLVMTVLSWQMDCVYTVQTVHWQGSRAGRVRWRWCVATMFEQSQCVCHELLPRSWGRPCSRWYRTQDSSQRLHQGLYSAPVYASLVMCPCNMPVPICVPSWCAASWFRLCIKECLVAYNTAARLCYMWSVWTGSFFI